MSNLVQPIVVSSEGTHEGTVRAAVMACGAIFLQKYVYASSSDEDRHLWEQWLNGPFTKSVRRADPKKLKKLKEEYSFSSFRMRNSKGEALAFSPMEYPFPKSISKTQVAGTEMPRDGWTHPPSTGFVLAINPDVEMTTGKTAAQCCHAWLGWHLNSFNQSKKGDLWTTEILRITDDRETFQKLSGSDSVIRIHDAGKTEVDPGTLTVIAGYIRS